MRKLISILYILAIMITICGCGSAKSKNRIVQISAAESFLVALKADGTVVAAGPNSDELKIDDWKNVKKIVAGFDTLTLRGSIIAAAILTLLPELLRGLSNYRMLIYAIVLIIMMLFNWAPAARDWRARMVEKFKGKKAKKEVA